MLIFIISESEPDAEEAAVTTQPKKRGRKRKNNTKQVDEENENFDLFADVPITSTATALVNETALSNITHSVNNTTLIETQKSKRVRLNNTIGTRKSARHVK